MGYNGAATGKGRQIAKSELEKLNYEELTCLEAINHAARIIHLSHEDNKDKDYELKFLGVVKNTLEVNINLFLMIY